MATFSNEYNTEGRCVACTYDGNLKHKWSWRVEFDAAGTQLAYIYAKDPTHKWPWRKLEEI